MGRGSRVLANSTSTRPCDLSQLTPRTSVPVRGGTIWYCTAPPRVVSAPLTGRPNGIVPPSIYTTAVVVDPGSGDGAVEMTTTRPSHADRHTPAVKATRARTAFMVSSGTARPVRE